MAPNTLTLPMFPLGTVLFPTMPLPLHVFEERYRALMRDVLGGPGEFGVVLIERGHEVGGGDVRTSVGCTARVLDAVELPDGRWAVHTVGDRRIEVVRWLPDAPYPRAEVIDAPDADEAGADLGQHLASVVESFRDGLTRAASLGDPVPPADLPLAPDAATAVHQMAALAPLGPFDRQALLAAPTTARRLALLGDLLSDLHDALDFRTR